MRIVIDTNIIIAAIIRQGIVRETLLAYPDSFVTPEFCIEEAWDHREDWHRRGLREKELEETFGLLVEDVLTVVPESIYSPWLLEAKSIIDDPDDIHVVALALAVSSEGVWTFDISDFSNPALQRRINVLTTSEARALLKRQRD